MSERFTNGPHQRVFSLPRRGTTITKNVQRFEGTVTRISHWDLCRFYSFSFVQIIFQNKISLSKSLHEEYLKTVVECETLEEEKKKTFSEDDFDLTDVTINGTLTYKHTTNTRCSNVLSFSLSQIQTVPNRTRLHELESGRSV